MKKFPGRCHCGNITFEFAWPTVGLKLPARACSCSFCVKHGGVYTSHPDGVLEVAIDNATGVNRYQFGQKSAEFLICRECGVIVIALCTIDDSEYAVVNINTFEDLDRDDFERETTDFDGESHDERLARRKRNWTGTVMMRVK